MKKYLLVLGLLPLLFSCNNSQNPSSAQTSGNSSSVSTAQSSVASVSVSTAQSSVASVAVSSLQSEKEEALSVVKAGVAANNFTMNAIIEVPEQSAQSVTYLFNDKVSCLAPVGTDPMYFIINGNSIDGYFKNNNSGKYASVGSTPTTLKTFTLDYIFSQMTKETLEDIFKAVKPEDVKENSGTYHIDEVILHLDAAKAAAIMHIDASSITDGFEWPLTNIDFTIKDEHLKTFSAEQCALSYDPTKGVSLMAKPSKSSIEISQYGTTVINLPSEIPAPQA